MENKTTLEKLEQLAIDYAENRSRLRDIKKRIDNIPLTGFFNRALTKLGEIRDEMVNEHYITWKGWTDVLDKWNDVCEPEDVIDINSDVSELAKLFDDRRELKIQGGNIRRKIYICGMALIKDRKIS